MMPLCIKCQTHFRVIKTGIVVVVMFGDPPQPQELWSADILQCPGCGAQIVSQYASAPFAVHRDSDFQKEILSLVHGDHVHMYERPQFPQLPCLFTVSRQKVEEDTPITPEGLRRLVVLLSGKEPEEDLPAGEYLMQVIETETVDTPEGPTLITTVRILDKEKEE